MPPSFNIFKSSKKKAAAAAASADAASAAPRVSQDGGGAASVAGKSTMSGKLLKKSKKKNSISQSIAPTPLTAEEIELEYMSGNENGKAHIPYGAEGEHGGGVGHDMLPPHHPSLPVIRSMNGSRRAMSPYGQQEEEDDFVLVHPHRAPSGAPQAAFMGGNAGSQYAHSTRQMHPEVYDDPLMFPPTYPSQPTRYEAGLRYPKFVSSITGTPVVSQYIQPDPHHPPMPPPMAERPSRSWTPIPSVEREESPRDEVPGQADQSWVNYDEHGNANGHHDHDHPGGLLLAPSHFAGDSHDPRISTTAEGGHRLSGATLDYVDNTNAFSHQIVSRPLTGSHPSMSRSQHASGTHGEPSLYHDGDPSGDGQAMALTRRLASNPSATQSYHFAPEPGSRAGSRPGSQAESYEHENEHEHIRRVSSPTTILPRKPLQSHPSQSQSHSRSHGSMGAHSQFHTMHDPEHSILPHPGGQHTLRSSHSMARSHATGHGSHAPNGFEHHEFEHPYEDEMHHVMPSNHSVARSHATQAASQMRGVEPDYERAPGSHFMPSRHSTARSHATGAASQGHGMQHERAPSVHTILLSNHSMARSHATGAASQGHDVGEHMAPIHHIIPSNQSMAARSHVTGAASHEHDMAQEHAANPHIQPSNHSMAAKSRRTAHGSQASRAPGKSSDRLSVAHANVVVPSKPISSRPSLASKQSARGGPSRNGTVALRGKENQSQKIQSQSSRSIVRSPPMTRGRWIPGSRSVSRDRSRSPYASSFRRRRRSVSSDTRSISPAHSRAMRRPPMRRRRSTSSRTRSASPVRSRARTSSMRQPPPPTSIRSGYAKPHNMAPPTIVQLTDRPSRHTNSGSWGDTTPVETRPARRTLAPSAIEPGIIEQEYWDDKEVVLDIYHYIVPIGVKVMFQDQEGNMILRMAKTGKVLTSAAVPQRCAPIVVHDANGRELYRSTSVKGPSPSAGDIRGGKFTRRHDSPAGAHLTKTIMIDETGKQIVL
ncbi:hypothetical protein D9619_000442 [Psilocybe cf. subviscida]|uniref:Uncharacterized protein n=1 Tax=Psilocybe cf. subviscida TaxID=2480587 RepID=A0A8H5BE73_9AGAR|nr:hypothetical protein D9619_000442 [Psilocybe cf. subviscida]